jgi:SAM-dependent methyltransferase
MKALDVGCGANKQPGAIGMDRASLPGVDIVHDLNTYPYPVPDNDFDRVYCYSVLEHLDDVMRTTAELHRVLKPGGELHISLPHYSHPRTYGDPTHRHFFSYRVVEYLAGNVYPYYGGVRFRVKQAMLGQPGRGSVIRTLMNRNPYLTERLLAAIRPVESMYFVLAPIK